MHDKLLLFIELKDAEIHDKLLIITYWNGKLTLLKFCKFVKADVTLTL